VKIPRVLFLLHRWIGLCSLLFLIIVGSTGSILVYKAQLIRWLHPECFRIVSSAPPISIDDALHALVSQHPDETLRYIFPPLNDQTPYLFETVGGKNIYLHPATGEVLGTIDTNHGLIGWIRALHTTLALGTTGELLLTFLGAATLLLLCSGVYFALHQGWKFRGNQLSRQQDTVRFLHTVGGLWMTPILLLLVLTGLALHQGPLLTKLLNHNQRSSEKSSLPSFFAPAQDPTLQDLVTAAEKHLPNSRTTRIALPQQNSSRISLRLKRAGELHPNGMTFLTLDRQNGALLHQVLSTEGSLASRLLRYPLHIGAYGGQLTQLLHFLAGLAMALLSILGGWLWLRRKRCLPIPPAAKKISTL
jgi:uncharacterized iron-regulated membrane protein